MLLEGSELTKEDHESQLYDDFEYFRQHKGETIHDYYVWFAKLINDMRNIKMTMSRMHLNSKFVNNMLFEWGRFVTAVKLNRGLRDSNYDQLYAYLNQHEAHANENKMMLDRFTQNTVDPLGNNARGVGATGYGGAQKRVGNANSGQARQIKCYNYNGICHIERNCTQPKRPQNPRKLLIPLTMVGHVEKELPKTEKSSMVCSIISWKIAIIHRWNVPGALQSPKGMHLYAKVPYGQVNVVFSWSFGSIGI
nr:integrase, catalytic region, zinc finger, CCHC-type, peptidase aspartic, catalytic [Tanacetum cinerariifolium]